MKLLTFERITNPNGGNRLGLLWPGGAIIDLREAANELALRSLPTCMVEYLEGGVFTRETVQAIMERVDEFSARHTDFVFSPQQVHLKSPLPRPASLRKFSVSESHYRAFCSHCGKRPSKAWNKSPRFVYRNHQAVYGGDVTIPRATAGGQLDFEFGIACVIGMSGVNIPAEEAMSYVAGFAISNCWTLRDLAAEEFNLRVGPSKSQDFATSLGPYLVSVEEAGALEKLTMQIRINGELLGSSDTGNSIWNWGHLIAVASQDAPLFPGDILCMSDPGGSLMELRKDEWLQPGDQIELQVENLGTLRNSVE
ncbi:MAG: fumarylacetoacetate hydrolase family protein [Planctomycetota bacterium]|nr:fumarylacetoacetate hydrolase family protein [Planctomycetota bacterium]MDA1139056.1 fumarylacetoacetate hydrolase family protein [Planctomycetota bacterium]